MRVCIIDDCDKPHHGRGYCKNHYWRAVDLGDPLAERPKKTDICYRAAHLRVTRVRGKASVHNCAHCGGAARDWAYDHTDPAPLVDPINRQYSLNIDRYMPLCKKCHTTFDIEAVS